MSSNGFDNFGATHYFYEKDLVTSALHITSTRSSESNRKPRLCSLGKQGFGNSGVTQRIIAAMALIDITVRITNLVVVASIDNLISATFGFKFADSRLIFINRRISVSANGYNGGLCDCNGVSLS